MHPESERANREKQEADVKAQGGKPETEQGNIA